MSGVMPQTAEPVPLVSSDDDEIGLRLARQLEQPLINPARRRQHMDVHVVFPKNRPCFLAQIMGQHLLHFRRRRRVRRKVQGLFPTLGRVEIDEAHGDLARLDFTQLAHESQHGLRHRTKIRADENSQCTLMTEPRGKGAASCTTSVGTHAVSAMRSATLPVPIIRFSILVPLAPTTTSRASARSANLATPASRTWLLPLRARPRQDDASALLLVQMWPRLLCKSRSIHLWQYYAFIHAVYQKERGAKPLARSAAPFTACSALRGNRFRRQWGERPAISWGVSNGLSEILPIASLAH